MLKLKRHKTFVKDMAKSNISEQHYTKFILYVSCLIKEEELPKEALDHPLQGEYCDFRELHISGDLLLIYRIIDDTLELIRLGSHSQLFK
ncbi:type II toxin-antitoxin system YafQ family toxin [Arcobacter sp. FWKO B]|uniref:type II toxin-antitoxin system YafQ family toxin n=1 Tax=Arcobacter sp. FWKO B TaxID=2593672 RepID=UPI0018A56722|nr:type II toxin-antitoxin system YafQ family toxin [Arcobacter sp. FWKO B]QOG11296.1 type II toxin-antitoxin system YafQ family toxin [Arcobacter sp. FWKO B]